MAAVGDPQAAHRAITPLEVGGRPGIAWVSTLPRKWTTPPERLLLMILAADTFEESEWCKPGAPNLAQWSGMFESSVWELLKRLRNPVHGRRPALIEHKPGGKGRRTWYRLRFEVWDPSAEAGVVGREALAPAAPGRFPGGPLADPSPTTPVPPDTPYSQLQPSSNEGQKGTKPYWCQECDTPMSKSGECVYCHAPGVEQVRPLTPSDEL